MSDKDFTQLFGFEEPPVRFTISGGHLKVKGGRIEAHKRLKEWQRQCKIPDDTPVCVIRREDLKELIFRQHLNVCA